MWMQYEHHLTTLSGASKPKTLKNQEFHVFPVNFGDLSPPKPNHVQECRSIDFREYWIFFQSVKNSWKICFWSYREKSETSKNTTLTYFPRPILKILWIFHRSHVIASAEARTVKLHFGTVWVTGLARWFRWKYCSDCFQILNLGRCCRPPWPKKMFWKKSMAPKLKKKC